MIKQLKLITKLESRNFLEFNTLLHTKDPHQRFQILIKILAFVILFFLVIFLFSSQVYLMILLNKISLAFTTLACMSTVVIFILSFFSNRHSLYQEKGYEILCTLPVSKKMIAVSRITRSYLTYLLLNAVLMMPSFVIYTIYKKTSVSFCLSGICGILFLPMIPYVCTALLNSMIVFASSYSRHKATISILCNFIVIGLPFLPVFKNQDFFVFQDLLSKKELSLQELDSSFTLLEEQIQNLYLPASLFSSGCQGNLKDLILLIFLSLIVFISITLLLISRYETICQRSFSGSFKQAAPCKQAAKTSLLNSLYKKEKKYYFSCPVYASNTIIGPLLSILFSFSLFFIDLSGIQKLLPLPIHTLCPVLWSAVCCFFSASSISVSMEGKNIWILKSLPIPVKTILDSKILWNLTLMVPGYLSLQIALFVLFSPGFFGILWQIFFPVLYVFFLIILTIHTDLKFGKFDWDKEETMVKASLSSLIGSLCDLITSALIAAILFLFPGSHTLYVQTGFCILLLIGSILLYRKNNNFVL